MHYPEISLRDHPYLGCIIPKCLSRATPFGLYYPEITLLGHPVRVLLSRNVRLGSSLGRVVLSRNSRPGPSLGRVVLSLNLSIGVKTLYQERSYTYQSLRNRFSISNVIFVMTSRVMTSRVMTSRIIFYYNVINKYNMQCPALFRRYFFIDGNNGDLNTKCFH